MSSLSHANTEDSPSRNPNCPLLRYQPVVHRPLQAKTSGRADSQHKRRMKDQVTDALKLSLFQKSTSQIVHSCYSAHVCKLQSNITSLYRHSFPRNAKALKPLSCPTRSKTESQIKNPVSIRTHDIRQKITTTTTIFAIAMKSLIFRLQLDLRTRDAIQDEI